MPRWMLHRYMEKVRYSRPHSPRCNLREMRDSRDPALAGGVAAEAGQLQLLHLPLVVIGQLRASWHVGVGEHGHPVHQPAVALGQHGAPDDVPSAAVMVHEAPHVACTGAATRVTRPYQAQHSGSLKGRYMRRPCGSISKDACLMRTI